MDAVAQHCRTADPDAFFAAQFLPSGERGVAYALSAMTRQLWDILTAAAECGSGGCGSDSGSDKANTCTTTSACGGTGGGACSGFGAADRLRVCDSVLDFLWNGEKTGKPELDAAADLARQRNWPIDPWKQWCRGVIALHSSPRVATWRRLRELCEQEAGVLARITGSALSPAWQPDASHSAQALAWATALRLTRLIPAVHLHWQAGRLLLPLDDLVAAGLSEQDIARFSESGGTAGDSRWQPLVEQQAQRAANLYRGGVGWFSDLPPAARRALAVYGELQLAWWDRWRQSGGDPFTANATPTLTTLGRLARVPRAIGVLVR